MSSPIFTRISEYAGVERQASTCGAKREEGEEEREGVFFIQFKQDEMKIDGQLEAKAKWERRVIKRET